jgi:group II intron reverse transcriptase/maturase
LDTITRPQSLLAAKAKHDRTHQFNNIYYFICRRDWIEEALSQVLDNKGSGTAGIDGQTIAGLREPEQKTALVSQIRTELKGRDYKPTPARRAYIPKSNGEYRPLGIPTLKDRVVQCLLKMLLEPIYESDFAYCSSGFRPMRRTMDCIAQCYRNINDQKKYFWIIEGDIEGCFDHIHHMKLMQIIRKRIADQHVLELLDRFLNAGIMENTLFKHTTEGVPQGGIFSPLLANIYLNELDQWWVANYHLTQDKRYKRRLKGLGNYILIRYADDFVVLCNGTKQSAIQMKDELQTFLATELSLTLSSQKTLVTHVDDGFDFLGFHVQTYAQRNQQRALLVRPTGRNTQRLRDKIKEMTTRRTHLDSDALKIHAVNAVLRGWSEYYKHVSSSRTFSKLDFWVARRVIWWLAKKHKLGILNAVRQYNLRQGNRNNIGIQVEDSKTVWLFRMADQHIVQYRQSVLDNPFISRSEITPITNSDAPVTEDAWSGSSTMSEWKDAKLAALRRDGFRCTSPNCRSTQNLDVHHIIPRAQRPDLVLNLDNLTTLCEKCHMAAHRTGVLDTRIISVQSLQDPDPA